MLTLRELAAAARRAQDLASRDDAIVEIEVFAAANDLLLNRLNYTSHFPCNGLEEPKSSSAWGVGIRVIVQAEGERRLGFGSETGDLSDQGLLRALERAKDSAVPEPDLEHLPQPPAGPNALADYADQALAGLKAADLVAAGWKALDAALAEFQAAGADPRDGLIVGGDVTFVRERVALAGTWHPEPRTDESTLVMASLTAMIESAGAKGSGWEAHTRLDGFDGRSGAEAARAALAARDGVRPAAGEYAVVLGPQPVTDLLNNIILPSLGLGAIYAGSSSFLGKFGQSVAPEFLSVYDDGARPGLLGSKGMTDEGMPTGRTDLIAGGRVAGYLTDVMDLARLRADEQAADKLGADPTEALAACAPRSGFRFAEGGGRSHARTPAAAATNVFLESSAPVSHDALLAGVKDGLYLGRIWYTYPVNGLGPGDFTATVVGDSFVIRDGRLAEPIAANTLRIQDNILRVLAGITAVGDNPRGTMVWAADEICWSPEVAVSSLRLEPVSV